MTTQDPLIGFSPSDIVIGPGGQTLADVARYRLATGGGTIRPRVLPQHKSLTADECRAWAVAQDGKGMLGARARAVLAAAMDAAIAAGSGRGGAGVFTVGTAAGSSIVSFVLSSVE